MLLACYHWRPASIPGSEYAYTVCVNNFNETGGYYMPPDIGPPLTISYGLVFLFLFDSPCLEQNKKHIKNSYFKATFHFELMPKSFKLTK